MAETLEYQSRRDVPRVWLRRLVKAAVALAVIVLLVWGGLSALYYFAVLSARISVTVVNHSDSPVLSATVWVNQRRTLLDLGDIGSGGQSTRSTRFDRDHGPGRLHVTYRGGTIDEQLGNMLLTDNGPFEYTYTFYNDRIHVEGFAGTKGDHEYDISLTPTTAPTPTESGRPSK